jgi:hypothetical protein
MNIHHHYHGVFRDSQSRRRERSVVESSSKTRRRRRAGDATCGTGRRHSWTRIRPGAMSPPKAVKSISPSGEIFSAQLLCHRLHWSLGATAQLLSQRRARLPRRAAVPASRIDEYLRGQLGLDHFVRIDLPPLSRMSFASRSPMSRMKMLRQRISPPCVCSEIGPRAGTGCLRS